MKSGVPTFKTISQAFEHVAMDAEALVETSSPAQVLLVRHSDYYLTVECYSPLSGKWYVACEVRTADDSGAV